MPGLLCWMLLCISVSATTADVKFPIWTVGSNRGMTSVYITHLANTVHTLRTYSHTRSFIDIHTLSHIHTHTHAYVYTNCSAYAQTTILYSINIYLTHFHKQQKYYIRLTYTLHAFTSNRRATWQLAGTRLLLSTSSTCTIVWHRLRARRGCVCGNEQWTHHSANKKECYDH